MATMIPAWFDAKTYMANKLAQMKATDPSGGWTEKTLDTAFKDAGFEGTEGAYNHFMQFGKDENVSPNAGFDAGYYLAAKADQLNAIGFEGKLWSAATVMDAFKKAGITSAWEHYQQFGSQEGIATSKEFDSELYFQEKTKLLNDTKEGGRTDWTVAEVKDTFAAAGLTALEHYNQFGKTEFKEGTKFDDPTPPSGDLSKYDPYTGVYAYATLKDALAAQTEGALAEKYSIGKYGDAEADKTLTVEQYDAVDAVISGSTSPSQIQGEFKYILKDDMAAIEGAKPTALSGAEKYIIDDTLANIAAGDDKVVNSASSATANVAFAADAKSEAITTTVSFNDIKGNLQETTAKITIANDDDTHTGAAVIKVDGSGTTAIGATGKSFDLNKVFALASNVTNISFDFVGSDKDDFITAHEKGGSITGGEGKDTITLGKGADLIDLTETTKATDTVVFLKDVKDLPVDTIKGFTVGALSAGGDVLNIKAFATGFTSGKFASAVINKATTYTAKKAIDDSVYRFDTKGSAMTSGKIAALFGATSAAAGKTGPWQVTASGHQYVLITEKGDIWFINNATGVSVKASECYQVGTIESLGTDGLTKLVADNFA